MINTIFDKDIKNLWDSLYTHSSNKPLFKRDKKLYTGCYFGVLPTKKEVKPIIRIEFKGSINLAQFSFVAIDLEITNRVENLRTLIVSPKFKKDYQIFKKYIPYFFYNETKDEISSLELKQILIEMSQVGDLLLENKKIMSKSNLIGLYGELIFLEKQIAKSSKSFERHINAWQKNERANNDFIYSDKEHEIKTTALNNKTVRISSEYQLESNNGNQVFLEYLVIEEKENGRSLDEIVSELRDKFKNNVKLLFKFNLKLEIYGYVSCNLTKNKKFELFKHRKIKISDDFPKLTKSNLPNQISDVRYTVDISKFINE
jgi:hypothetical protein